MTESVQAKPKAGKIMVVAEILTTATATLIALIDLLGIVLCLIGFVDAVRRPASTWLPSGYRKSNWVILTAVGVIFGLFFFGGLFIGIVYLFAIRPKVAAPADER